MTNIKYIQIISERHCGTKWFKRILRKFSKDVQVSNLEKHWFLNEYKMKNFLDEGRKNKNKLKLNNIDYDAFNDITNKNLLIIIMSRYIYDWIISMRKDPHHVKNKWKIHNLSISDFIRVKWNCNADETKFSPSVNNIIDLRNKKYINWFTHIPKYASNYIFIRYEQLLANAENVVYKIGKKYDIDFKNNIKIWTNKDKIVNSLYNNPYKITNVYNKKDINFIYKNINTKIEKKMGYKNIFNWK